MLCAVCFSFGAWSDLTCLCAPPLPLYTACCTAERELQRGEGGDHSPEETGGDGGEGAQQLALAAFSNGAGGGGGGGGGGDGAAVEELRTDVAEIGHTVTSLADRCARVCVCASSPCFAPFVPRWICQTSFLQSDPYFLARGSVSVFLSICGLLGCVRQRGRRSK